VLVADAIGQRTEFERSPSNSMKHAARRPSPPLPRPGSSSASSRASGDFESQLRHGLSRQPAGSEIQQVVAEMRPDQELGREVRQPCARPASV